MALARQYKKTYGKPALHEIYQSTDHFLGRLPFSQLEAFRAFYFWARARIFKNDIILNNVKTIKILFKIKYFLYVV